MKSFTGSTEVVKVLQDLHCKKPTFSKLQHQFFSRDQRKSESIDEYSHPLIDILLKILDEAPCTLDKELTMQSRLAEGVHDRDLKHKLKRLNVERPALKFHELRDCARTWIDDSVASSSQSHEECS